MIDDGYFVVPAARNTAERATAGAYLNEMSALPSLKSLMIVNSASAPSHVVNPTWWGVWNVSQEAVQTIDSHFSQGRSSWAIAGIAAPIPIAVAMIKVFLTFKFHLL
jgi:hypothetical protein